MSLPPTVIMPGPVIELVHLSEVQPVSQQRLQNSCTLFQDDLSLLDHPYCVKSKLGVGDFQTFVAALEDRPVTITTKNFPGLFRLCDEFGFSGFSVCLSQFLKFGDRELDQRVLSLREGEISRERAILRLETELGRREVSEAKLRDSLNRALDVISGLE
jgi:hypothetical protein